MSEGEREKLVHLFWTGWLAGFAHDGPFAVVTCASWPYRKTWILELIPWATATHHSEGLQGKCCRTSNDQVVYGRFRPCYPVVLASGPVYTPPLHKPIERRVEVETSSAQMAQGGISDVYSRTIIDLWFAGEVPG
ncbi:hypothetical protein C0Q70_01999 [Pomacea canaliculata]|uniref:Uncharacterized protein n=1 Tax=Pomacea canaliculata TaxID=400727 RepID=A0A2T7Q128_POMCA|nr:hypothetical protein C0Q70_01999 [Pomacea canaliculata]